MTSNDHREFVQHLTALAELFDAKVSAARMALYFETLREFPLREVIRALNHAAKTCKFFPRPAELREFLVGDSEDAVEAAWMAFRSAMSRLGYMSSVLVQDAALGEAITAVFGGWDAACGADLSPEMWASRRKEFGRVYRVMRQRRVSGTRYLPGAAERMNGGRLDYMPWVPLGVIGTNGEVRALNSAEAAATRLQLREATPEPSPEALAWPTEPQRALREGNPHDDDELRSEGAV